MDCSIKEDLKMADMMMKFGKVTGRQKWHWLTLQVTEKISFCFEHTIQIHDLPTTAAVSRLDRSIGWFNNYGRFEPTLYTLILTITWPAAFF